MIFFNLKAYKDLLKNKEIIDYFGENQSNLSSCEEKQEKKEKFDLASLSSLSLATLGLGTSKTQKSIEKSNSKDNLCEIDDEGLLDENLLEDLS